MAIEPKINGSSDENYGYNVILSPALTEIGLNSSGKKTPHIWRTRSQKYGDGVGSNESHIPRYYTQSGDAWTRSNINAELSG